jgi:preprotein translocase subunit SecD
LILVLAGSGCGGSEKGNDLSESLTRVVLEPTDGQTMSELELLTSIEVMSRRLDALHVKDPYLAREGKRIALIAATDALERSLPVLIRPGRLEFFDLQGDLTGQSRDVLGSPIAHARPLTPRPNTVVVTCGPHARYCPGLPEPPRRKLYYLFKYDPGNKEHPIPELTGDDLDLKGTRQDFDQGEPVVLVQFTKSGAKKFQDVTVILVKRGRQLANDNGWVGDRGDIANQQFAIVLDREMKSAPAVDFDDYPSGIPGDNGVQITGLTVNGAKDLALVLQSGALPLAFRVVSKETRHK